MWTSPKYDHQETTQALDHQDTLASQLRDFRISESKCHCCSSGHADRKNPCDREIVCRCIRRWFVSEEAFEDCVRAFIPLCFNKQLGRYGFPYWLLLASGFQQVSSATVNSFLPPAFSHWMSFLIISLLHI